MKDISVIILNYNSGDYTVKCAESILEKTSSELNYEIIIVDNNSKNDEYEKIKHLDNHENISVYRSKINLGFSGGNMFGYQFADAKYIFFLNNDCELVNDNLAILYDFMEKNPKTGLCAGQMYDADLKLMKSINYLPSLSLKVLGNSTMRLFKPENYPKMNLEYSKPLKVESLAGAAMFFRDKAFCEIGAFDLNYFIYCEEEDLGMKLKFADYQVHLIPEAKYIHYLSKSTGLNYKAEREFYISLMYFYRKYNNSPKYLALKFFYFIKLARKFYKDAKFLKLAFLALAGGPQKYSLRHEQIMESE